MPEAIQTIDDFLQVVRKSGLVEEPRLAAAVAPWTDHAVAVPEELVRALIDAGLLTDWQVEQLRKGRHKGFLLGKYRLLRLLGTGGMSSVYLAEHTTLHGHVAIKVLPVKRVDQTSYLARFEREAREAFRLNHPNIVRPIDLDTSGSIHFIAMEYVDGVDLAVKVKQDGPLGVREAADYIRQAALGLHRAHEAGLVHRDIKPANLMLDRHGNVKILDFGLALARADDDNDGSLTKTHDEKVLGTADYLAPEQARDSHIADRRSDIYALGCTLHYLLMGRAPFAKGSIAERIQAHMRRPPPNLLEERGDVPPAIAELYFRMMEKHPDARPQTAQEVADALGVWLATKADVGPRTRPDTPRRPPPRRSRPAADPGSSNVHYAPQLRPGSSVSGSPGPRGSVGDSGPFAFGPAARPTATAPPPVRTGGTAPAPVDTAFAFDKKPLPSATQASGQPTKKPVRKPVEFAGLPLGFWLMALVGLVTAIGLAIKLFVLDAK